MHLQRRIAGIWRREFILVCDGHGLLRISKSCYLLGCQLLRKGVCLAHMARSVLILQLGVLRTLFWGERSGFEQDLYFHSYQERWRRGIATARELWSPSSVNITPLFH